MAPTTCAQNLEELETEVNNLSENMNSLNLSLKSLSKNLNSLTQQVHELVSHIKDNHQEYHYEDTHFFHYDNTHLFHSPRGSPNTWNKVPKVETHKLDGSELARWVSQMEHYLSLYHIQDDETKIHVGVLYMDQELWKWWQWHKKFYPREPNGPC
jgi:hypothetical protein